jgi:Xaa-Pro aminopeptidase
VSRADRIAARLAGRELDFLLITNLTNLRYATGFTGSNGFAIVGGDLRRFVTDFRYVEQSAYEVLEFDREQAPPEFVRALEDGWPAGEHRLGFEDGHLTVRDREKLREVLPDGIELVPAGDVVEAERAVKEEGELAYIRSAATLLDDIYDWLREWGIVGRSEREVAVALEHEMRLRGASDPSFPSIVASGPRGALPHAVRTDEPILTDTLVTLDIGAVLDGYCSDCTRTWATGENLPGELREAYDVVCRAQRAAVEAVRPGPEGREIDAVARGMIEDAGHGEHFGHGLGHGVGLEVHEAPRLARTASEPLVENNVVTVEPGVYLPGVGGVRIEDLVIVTKGGCEVLTCTTRDFVVVD